MRAAILTALLALPIASMKHRAIYGERNQNRPARAFLLSHRSCSEDPQADCNRVFFEQLERLRQDTADLPFFKQLLYQGLPKDVVTNPKWEKHLEAERGRGYWFWKPALTNRLLKQREILDGDLVVWLDADYGPKRWGTKEEWVELLRGNFKEDFFVADQKWRECDWTKGDIYAEFNVSFERRQYGLARQAYANFWVMRVNERTRDLFSKWEDLVSNYHLVSDEYSFTPNAPAFIETRHDQSLLSMLLKASMITIVNDNHNRKYEKEMHPKYGVPGLRAFQGTLGDLMYRQNQSNLISEPTPRKSSNVQVCCANQWICIKDECHDLMGQPKGFVPRGVAPE